MHAILSVVLLASTVSAWGLKHRSNHQQWSVDHPQPVEWSDWDEQWYAAHPEDDLISEPLTRRQVDLTGPNFPVNVTQLEYEVVRNARKWSKRTVKVTESITPADSRLRARAGPTPATYSTAGGLVDGIWSVPVSIGTPPQTFQLFVDTGSSELTIPGPNCTSCGSVSKFNPAASSTYVDTGKKISTSYALGTGSFGEWIYETVTFGSKTFGRQSAPKQAVLLATSLSDLLLELPVDGLLGCAWAGFSVTKTNSTPFSLYTAGASNFFSLRLTSKVGYSYMNMGITRTLVTGLPRYYTITMNGGNTETYWQIRLSAPNVNGVVAIDPRATHIFDSGTQYIVAPPASAAQFWAKIPGSARMLNSQNYYTFPCNTKPKVSFTMYRTANSYAIADDDFNLGYVNYNTSLCVGAVTSQALNIGINGTSWILGETFYKNWLVIHNMGDDASIPSIGLVVPKDRTTIAQKRSAIWANKRSIPESDFSLEVEK